MNRPPLLALLSALFCFLILPVSGSAEEPHDDHCVVLVSIDGLAGFYLDDPKAELPTIRKLAADGVRADGMVCSFPTVTWPNHTTLVTGTEPGRHGVIGNNYLDRRSGEKIPLIPDPLFDKEQIVRTPTVYDVAHRAGLVTAGIIWPASRNARTLDWTVPDMGARRRGRSTAPPTGWRNCGGTVFPSTNMQRGCGSRPAVFSGTGSTRGWRGICSRSIRPTC